MAQSSACLYSTIRNVSGAKVRIPYIDFWGRDLANNEEYSGLGHPTEWLRQWRNWSPAAVAALKKTLDDGVVKIINTPSVVLNDVAGSQQLILKLDNSVLKAVDVCSGAAAVTLAWTKDP